MDGAESCGGEEGGGRHDTAIIAAEDASWLSGDGNPDTGCCQMREQSVRVELEGRIVALEVKMEANRKEAKEYVNSLMECIQLRDERLIARNSQIEEKNKIIEQMKEEMAVRDGKIAELTAAVEKLSATLEVRGKSEAGQAHNRLIDAPKSKRINKKKEIPVTLDIFKSESFERHFTIELPPSTKRQINPFEIEKEISGRIGGTPKSIGSHGRNGILVEVRNKQQSEKIRSLATLCNLQCNTRSFTFYNETKGMIYIYNNEMDDIESFCAGLKEEYDLSSVIEANWIKARNNGRAFLIATNQNELPKYLRIIGEFSLTKVYPYRDLPRKCNRCLTYGHPMKFCKSAHANCERCAGPHATADCMLGVDECATCYNCSGSHPSGDASCPVKIKEEELLQIQKSMKISRRQAEKVLSGNGERVMEPVEYSRYIQIELNEYQRRKLCPFKMEKFFRTNGILRNNIRSERKCIIIKTVNPQQTTSMLNLKNVCDIPCVTSMHKTYNESKGLIYISQYALEGQAEESFVHEMATRHTAAVVQRANWIPTRSNDRCAYLITFQTPQIPEYIDIPGESDIKVYEYLPRPTFCKKCLEYGHREKFCVSLVRCSKCSNHQHSTADCDSPTPKCLQCEGPHRTGDKNCRRHRQEEEINVIRHRDRLNWNDARAQYFLLHPEEQNEYAEILKRQRRAERPTTVTGATTPVGETNSSDRSQRNSQRNSVSEASTPVVPCEDVVRPKVKRVGSNSGDEMELRTKKKGRIEDPGAELSDTTDELEHSSETNSEIRREVEQIFNEYSLHQ